MKHVFIFSVAALTLACNNEPKEEIVNLEDENTKLSYSMGVIYGQDMMNAKEQLTFLNDSAFIIGLKDAMASKSKIDPETAEQNLNAFFSKKQDSEANEAIELSRVFFEENKKKEGIVETESGLQYQILKEGKGAKPSATDKVKVHYHGTLLDGSVFDSSVDRGEPIEFGVSEVIPGWTEVLQLMPIGSKWKVYIPFNLGYGTRGSGPIKPYSTLVFEVELIDIVK
ncbi:MAG: FKBP-type peptidyl-prolyl cis-trans isomerase [Bacteroidia bacterium]